MGSLAKLWEAGGGGGGGAGGLTAQPGGTGAWSLGSLSFSSVQVWIPFVDTQRQAEISVRFWWNGKQNPPGERFWVSISMTPEEVEQPKKEPWAVGGTLLSHWNVGDVCSQSLAVSWFKILREYSEKTLRLGVLKYGLPGDWRRREQGL